MQENEVKRQRRQKVEWLRRFRLLGTELDLCCDELAYWRDKGLRMAGGMGSGEEMRKIVGLEQEIQRRMEELTRVREEIVAAVATVGEERLRLLLKLRYLDGLTLEQAAERMFYSWRQVQRLHSQALDLLLCSP